MQVNETVLRQGAELFGVNVAALHSLGGMDGAVYDYKQDSKGYVLKFVPATEEQLPVIIEKWDFVNYLAEHGVRVSRPTLSRAGRLVETVRDDGQVYAVFQSEEAAGSHVDGRHAEFNADLFRAWGRTMGKMHALTQSYTGGEHISDWRGEVRFMTDWCPDEAVREKWRAMEAYLTALPQPADAYGLVHNDLHPHNFLVDRGQITVIDFDVCNRHWFATDIGIALFHAAWMGYGGDQDPNTFLPGFYKRFMEGYTEENQLDSFWVGQLWHFLDYRRLLMFSVFSNEWREPRQTWQQQTLDHWRRGILAEIPVVEPSFVDE
ncbi:MAG TPA: phosphotransferase [Anaerolineae bacterium]|nr:phosphotransferase [Anaerolineae bacterium]